MWNTARSAMTIRSSSAISVTVGETSRLKVLNSTHGMSSSKAPMWLGFCLILCLAWPCLSVAAEQEALKADAEEYFRSQVKPFITTYCSPCHQSRRPTRAGLNFDPALKAPGHAAFSEPWKKAVARVKAH